MKKYHMPFNHFNEFRINVEFEYDVEKAKDFEELKKAILKRFNTLNRSQGPYRYNDIRNDIREELEKND